MKSIKDIVFDDYMPVAEVVHYKRWRSLWAKEIRRGRCPAGADLYKWNKNNKIRVYRNGYQQRQERVAGDAMSERKWERTKDHEVMIAIIKLKG